MMDRCMTGQIFNVTSANIKQLGCDQLVSLLRKLLICEASELDFPQSCINVTDDIDIPDGGEDGLIDFREYFQEQVITDYIPSSYALFQVKAGDINQAAWRNEILNNNTQDLKSNVKKVMDDPAGHYVAFCSQRDDPNYIHNSKSQIVSALLEGGIESCEKRVTFLGTNKIAEWTNKHRTAVLLVKEFLGIGSSALAMQSYRSPLCTSKPWGEGELKYVEDKEGRLSGLSNKLKSPSSCILIRGEPGVGKTRLAYEALGKDKSIAELSVYLDLNGNENAINTLFSEAGVGVKNGYTIFVIDNCSQEVFSRGENLVERLDNVSLICIGGKDLEYSGNTSLVAMSPSEETVSTLIEQINVPSGQKDWLINASGGFPIILDWVKRSPDLLEQIRSGRGMSDFPKRLFEQRISSANEQDSLGAFKKLFEALSSFAAFPKNHLEWLSDPSEEGFLLDESKESLLRKLGVLKKVGLISEVGDYYITRPKVLGQYYAVKFWESYENGVPELYKLCRAMPPDLNKVMCLRLNDLTSLFNHDDLMDNICGQDSPFVQAEGLKDSNISGILRAFSANKNIKKRLAKSCQKTLNDIAYSDIRRIEGNVRRNIVEMLENLAWSNDSFYMAMQSLFIFAVEENETWSNNATGNFCEKFQVVLSGTSATLELRFAFIDKTLQKSQLDKELIVIIQALDRALKCGSFNGSVPPQGEEHFIPTRDAIKLYYKEVISLLGGVICQKNAYSTYVKQRAGEAVIHNFRALHREKGLDLQKTLEKLVSDIYQHYPALHYKLIQCLADYKNLESDNWSTTLDIILEPKEIKQRLEVHLLAAPYGDTVKKDGKLINLAIPKVEKLAKDIYKENIDLSNFSEELLCPNNKLSYSPEFLKEYSKNVPLEKLLELEEALREHLLNKSDKANTRFYSALLALIRGRSDKGRKIVDDVFVMVEQDRPALVLDVLNQSQKDGQDLDKIYDLYKRMLISEETVISSFYGRGYRGVKTNEVFNFLRKICEHDGGVPIVIKAVGYIEEANDEKKDFLEKVFLRKTFVKEYVNSDDSVDEHKYYLSKNLTYILEQSGKAGTISSSIAKEIFSIVRTKGDDNNFRRSDVFNKMLATIAESNYKNEIWPHISEALTDSNLGFYDLFQVLGHGIQDHAQVHINIMEYYEHNVLIEWVNNEGENAAASLSWCLPAVIKKTNSSAWHPVIKHILEKYGDSKEIQALLESNLLSFMSVGDRAPYYKRYLSPLAELESCEKEEVKDWAKKMTGVCHDHIQREETYVQLCAEGVV